MNLHSHSYTNLFQSKKEQYPSLESIDTKYFGKKEGLFNLQETGSSIYVTPELTKKILSKNSWNLTYTKQKTNFNLVISSKYKFRFSENNICTADNGEHTIAGSWHTGYDNKTLKLNIALRIPLELVTLCKMWNVVETSENHVRLITPKISTGGIEWLTLEKP
ncbi:MAG: hypothetical protein KJO64_05835 [Bacteroidia bacterium]|nr:hypothetical protein [Bacteroidia bacterium]